MRLDILNAFTTHKIMARAAVTLLLACVIPTAAQADLDGHGPDAWRVTAVPADDTLNARMGPGVDYNVIEQFASDENGLQQITCVPYYTLRHYTEMTEAQINALPPRWCLMRSKDMQRAGWVAQKFIEPDDRDTTVPLMTQNETGDPLIDSALGLVHNLYIAFEGADMQADNPFMLPLADKYFALDLIDDLHGHGADVLYGAQDFEGEVTRIAPDPDQPMLRGMITINVDFINFEQPQRAVFRLRADTVRPDAPFRIFQIEHDEWSFP